jgi:hypothetical protein
MASSKITTIASGIDVKNKNIIIIGGDDNFEMSPSPRTLQLSKASLRPDERHVLIKL